MKKILKAFLIISVLFFFTFALASYAKTYLIEGDIIEIGQDNIIGASPIMKVPQGGTGAATFTAGECLVGNGTGAITTQACGGTSGGTSVLNDITDVSLTSTSTGNMLYLASDGLWKNIATSSLGLGGVSSVDMSVPTGLTVAGNPITTSGTLALTLTDGYNIPLTASTTQWNTAYNWGDHSVAGYLTAYTETDPIWLASSSDYLLSATALTLYDVLGQATSTLASHTSTYNHANYDIAYGWGDWNGNVDFSDDTNATAGTGISFTGDSIVFTPTEMSATTWGEGDLLSLTQVFDNSAANNPTWTYAGNSASLTNANLTVDTNVLFVDYTNDKVGIGTTTPQYLTEIYKASPSANEVLFNISTGADTSRFSIDEDGDIVMDGNLSLSNSLNANGTALTNVGHIYADSADDLTIYSYNNNSELEISDNRIYFYASTGDIDFESNSGSIYFSAGYVGIGTTMPDSPLEIYTDSPEANEVLFRVSTSDDSSRFSIDEDGDVNADGDLIVGGTATTSNLTVVTNSKLGTIEAGTWNGTAISTQYGGTGQDFSSSNGMLFLNAGSMSAEATSTVAGNGLTFTGTVLNFDGGDSPAGELGGTWASPTVDSGIFDDEYIKITDYNATTTIPATITTINSNTLEPMFSACIASTSEAFINATNLPFPQIKSAYTITAIHCNVVGGTNYTITLTDGSNATESITCDADGADDDGSIANGTVTASEQMYLDFGTPSGAVNYLCVSIYAK